MIEEGTLARHVIGRSVYDEGHDDLLDTFPEHFQIWITSTAIIEQNRRADQQPADEQVPHHPPCRGIPEEPIVRFQIQPQSQAFQMFKEDSTLAVDDGLW